MNETIRRLLERIAALGSVGPGVTVNLPLTGEESGVVFQALQEALGDAQTRDRTSQGEMDRLTASCLQRAPGARLYGVPIVSMSRDELLSALVFLGDKVCDLYARPAPHAEATR